MYKLIITIICLLLLQSCMHLINGGSKDIEFKARNVPTKLYINNIYYGYMPQKIKISRCHDHHIILSSKYQDEYYNLTRKESISLSFLSLIMGGYISHATDYGKCSLDILI